MLFENLNYIIQYCFYGVVVLDCWEDWLLELDASDLESIFVWTLELLSWVCRCILVAHCRVHYLHLELLHFSFQCFLLLLLEFLCYVTRLGVEVQHAVIVVLSLFDVQFFPLVKVILWVEVICNRCPNLCKLCLLWLIFTLLVPVDGDLTQSTVLEAKFICLQVPSDLEWQLWTVK